MPFDVKDNAKGRAAAEDSGNELGKRAIGLIGGFDSNKIVIIGLVAAIIVGGFYVWIRGRALITRIHSDLSAYDV